MSVDMTRWVISALTALGFILPAIGISHTFATVIRKRQAQERAKAHKAEIDAKYQLLEDEAKANGTFTALLVRGAGSLPRRGLELDERPVIGVRKRAGEGPKRASLGQ
jgi:hypothetical protein